MISDTLYVIGNGFDLYHGVNSTYEAFGAYVKRTDASLHSTFERYFSFEGNWVSLEETLAHLDADSLLEDASDWLVGYGSDAWRDSDNHSYQDEIADIVRALSEGLKDAFTQWVVDLEIPSRTTLRARPLPMDINAWYLNFNYTATLESLYQIPRSRILYIHNRAADDNSQLVLGHGADPTERQSRVGGEEGDFRVTEGNALIDQYFSVTFKPTGVLIAQNQAFFSNLAGANRVIIIGHSLSEVDLPYFREIVRHVDINNAEWTVTFYDPSSKPALAGSLDSVGVSPARRSLVPIDYLALAEA